MTQQDKLRLIGVMAQGYGIIPKLVMRDRDLTAEAKAVYAYICSYSGAGNSAFPSMELMSHDLGMSDKRLRKHRNMLVEKGYLIVEQERHGTGFKNNIYTLPMEVAEKNVGGHFVRTQNVRAQNVPTQNDRINNNNLNNNNLNNNNMNKEEEAPSAEQLLEQQAQKAFRFYEQHFGMLNPSVMSKIDMWLNEFDVSETGDILCYAMEQAAERQKQWPYAQSILKDWAQRNARTLNDVQALQAEFKRSKGGRASGSYQGNAEQRQVPSNDGARKPKSYTDKYLRQLQGETTTPGDNE